MYDAVYKQSCLELKIFQISPDLPAINHTLLDEVSGSKRFSSLCYLMHYFVTCTIDRFIFSKHALEVIPFRFKTTFH